MLTQDYVHGYHPRENQRLQDQAGTLVELLHADTTYSAGSLVLEAGCGIGAQTVTLAQRSPKARFTSIDLSAESLAQAKERTRRAGVTNVEFHQADIFALPYGDDSFDHVFVCFVLEHLSRPAEALVRLRRVLRTGGTITVIAAAICCLATLCGRLIPAMLTMFSSREMASRGLLAWMVVREPS